MSKLTKQAIQEIEKMTDAGISQREISRKLHHGRVTVKKYQNRYTARLISNAIDKCAKDIEEESKKLRRLNVIYNVIFYLSLIGLCCFTAILLYFYIN